MRWLSPALSVTMTALVLGCSNGGETYVAAGGSSGSAGASGKGSGGRGGEGGRASGGSGGSSAGTESSGGDGAGGTAGTRASGGSDASGGSAGTESSGGTAGQGGGCSGELEAMVGELCVAKTAQVTATGLGGPVTYSIDVTEVTRGQYEGWLATDPETHPSGNFDCQQYNLGYVPDAACMASAYQGPNAAHHPMVCVDWCDAEAYCAGVGKQLCGALLGGPSPYNTDDYHISRWLHACANDGYTGYPYEGELQPTWCNGPGYGAGTTVAVGSLSTCQSSRAGFSGIYDMSGNVAEWENACYGGGSLDCRTRGGAFDLDGLHCTMPRGYSLISAAANIGFRCCSL